jgi:hypothetical protein
MARSAASHIRPQFTVPIICDRWGGDGISHEDNLRFYADEIQEAAITARRARSQRDWKAARVTELVEEANAYSQWFSLRTRFKVPSDTKLKTLIETARQEAQRRREEEKRRREERLKEMQEAIEKWQAGDERVRLPWDCPDIFLRVRGEIVQTSRGAEVPLAHAVKILPIVRSGQTYEHNGHSIHLGHFRIDKIDQHGLKAGCHFIKREEIERLAQTLGL